MVGVQLMVVDIPMGQGLLVGKECEKACEDNFLKCTHNVSPTYSPSYLCPDGACGILFLPVASLTPDHIAQAGLTSPKEGEVYSGYKYFPYNPTKSDKERYGCVVCKMSSLVLVSDTNPILVALLFAYMYPKPEHISKQKGTY